MKNLKINIIFFQYLRKKKENHKDYSVEYVNSVAIVVTPSREEWSMLLLDELGNVGMWLLIFLLLILLLVVFLNWAAKFLLEKL